MFSIIISEKGGAERKEAFDKNEINVGRVQGNDLMLPKGNVSKHHARLLYRDGRFIVTDLKSTNGTYVNGRKIAQATIVREGDKIYIGDFVLRLDSGSSTSEAAPEDEPRNAPAARVNHAQAQAHATAPAGATGRQTAQAAAREPAREPAYAPHEAEEEAPPPPKPAVARPQPAGRGQTAAMAGNARSPAAAPVQSVAPPRQTGTAPPVAPAPVLSAPPPVRIVPRETAAQAARRLALITLVDRIAESIDLAPLKASATVDDALSQQIERTAREQAAAMRDEGEAPEGTDPEQLVRDAIRELVGLGPIGPLLDDDEVTEIASLRTDQVLATRGSIVALADAPFTGDEALARVIARLAHQAGEPWKEGETILERRLPRGAHMLAIVPPAAANHVLVIRKRRRVDSSLEDLVRSGALSRPMAVFLDACVQARANVLACASASSSATAVVAALCSAAPSGERIALLHDQEEIAIPQAQVIPLGVIDGHGEATVRAAARLHPDRLIVGALTADLVASTLEAIGEGAEGVVAAASAPTMRQLLGRLVTQTLLSRPGMGVDAARECVGEAFDVAIEVATLADGRPKVLRIAELGGADAKGIVARDLFTFTTDGSGEGTFVATGVVPRVVAEFGSRGVKVDPAIFKRSVGR